MVETPTNTYALPVTSIATAFFCPIDTSAMSKTSRTTRPSMALFSCRLLVRATSFFIAVSVKDDTTYTASENSLISITTIAASVETKSSSPYGMC